MSFAIPPRLDALSITLCISVDFPKEESYIGVWTRTLEGMVRAGGGLRAFKLVLWCELDAQPSEKGRDVLHRLDAVLASDALGVVHLDWEMYYVQNVDGVPGSVLWLEEETMLCEQTTKRLFPGVKSRFIDPEGQKKHGTTVRVVYH